MLTTLDRFIIKKYLSTFFFAVLIFSMIATVIDLSDKVDDFLEEQVSVRAIVFDYYVNYLPYINALLWMLYALLSVIFFTSRMAYNSEIIAILNSGTSFWRLARPYLIAAAVVAAINIAGNHYLVPLGNKAKVNFENTYIWKDNDKGETQKVHFFITPDTKVYVRSFQKRDSVALDFKVERFENNELVWLLDARRAEWEGAPDRWKVRDFTVREIDGMTERITARDELDTTFNFTPEDFVNFVNAREAMTTPELVRYVDRQRARGASNYKSYEVEIHRRTAEPFTIFILTILGLAIAGRKTRGGVGLHLAMGAGLGALLVFLSKFSITLANSGVFSAFIAVWTPNIIFGALAVWLSGRAQQ